MEYGPSLITTVYLPGLSYVRLTTGNGYDCPVIRPDSPGNTGSVRDDYVVGQRFRFRIPRRFLGRVLHGLGRQRLGNAQRIARASRVVMRLSGAQLAVFDH